MRAVPPVPPVTTRSPSAPGRLAGFERAPRVLRPFAFLLEARTPFEDDLRQRVVRDLVARLRRLLDPEHAQLLEPLEHGLELLLAEARALRQLRDAERDLRAGRRDEVGEGACRDLLLARRQ